ncbi:MAG: hypothetical protein M3132_03610 [Actinomycetia bacterium]|nr:hypothetical protein [Actinomycetes bacterium]
MTAHELTTALFWMVVAGYATYVGWNIYSAARRHIEQHHRPTRIADLTDRKASAAHPVIETDEAEWFTLADEDRLAG